MRAMLCTLALTTLVATPGLATTTLAHCSAERACRGTMCRDAAGMAMDFDLRFDAATADIDFNDDTLPRAETLYHRGRQDGASVYFFEQPGLRVAAQVFEDDTPLRVRLAFGPPDAPQSANQIFATCNLQEAS